MYPHLYGFFTNSIQMKIHGITLRLPPVLFAITVFFAAVCAMMYGSTNDVTYVLLAIPLCIILICVPLFTTYMSEKQLLEQEPTFRAKAKFSRARQISSSMVGDMVIVEGKILKVTGVLMGKPAYLLKDQTGEIVVKRFAFPETLVGVGAQVEVLGTVSRKLIGSDVIYINAAFIRPVKTFRQDEPVKETAVPSKEHTKIKKYH